MPTIRSNNLNTATSLSGKLWLAAGAMLLLCLEANTSAQTIEAYAKPKTDFNYIYTLDHEYETTLFRSEKFDPIVETEEGFVIMLQLGGKPKLVLLPFESGERRVAEKKYRGVGVTYTAYLDFSEGHLPFFSDQYYEVLKQEKGHLFIDYQLKGFRKTIEVPASQFIVKSAFEYHLEESLAEVRSTYPTFKITLNPPNEWEQVKTAPGPGTMTEAPTHIGLVQDQNLATNFQLIHTASATNLEDVLTDVWVDQHRLVVVPITYTQETAENVYYFVKVKGYDRPVLVKEFRQPKEGVGYSRVVRVASHSGEDIRFLEITESMHVDFYPQFHFLLPGQLAAVRETPVGHYLIAADGEYEVSSETFQLSLPRQFMQTWANGTIRNQLEPGDRLYEELIQFSIPATARNHREWQALAKLQSLASLYKRIQPRKNAGVRSFLQAQNDLEDGADRLQLSLRRNPKHTALPPHNLSYYNFWKKTFNEVNSQAARERNQDILRRQLLRAEILIGESEHQALADFLSSQIYTYSNFLPAPLNKFNQLDANPPLAASTILRFDFPLDQTFKLNPETLDPLSIIAPGEVPDQSNLLKQRYRKNWYLSLDGLDYWRNSILAKKEEIYDPDYWAAIEEKAEQERQRRLAIARKRLSEVQSKDPAEEGLLKSSDAPWIASGVWFAILLVTNTGFFALSKMMPTRQS